MVGNDSMYSSEGQYTEIILEIERCFRRSLNTAQLNFIFEDREIGGSKSNFVTECAAGEMSPMAVADKLRQVFGSDQLPTKSSSSGGGLNRSYVNSQIIALNAKGREEVLKFRKDVMKNKFITTDKIDGWIRRKSKKDGKPTIYNGRDREWGYVLSYWLPDKNEIKSLYVVSDGLLDRLRILSIKLSVTFGWSEAQSTTWVLTGVFPIIEAIEVGAEIYSEEIVANKVTLKIDPTSSNDQVIAVYKWARRNFFQYRETRNTTKSEQLALLYKLHEGKHRREKLRIWNENCNTSDDWEKSWYYDPETGLDNFQRDLKNAYISYLKGRKAIHNAL